MSTRTQKTTPAAASAKLFMAMTSPMRCRQVADLIRGKSVDAANRTLLLEKVKASKIMLKVLRSAVSNAEQKGVADLERLYVSSLMVNEGPRIKRIMSRAQGRADRITTRTSHIVMELAEKKAQPKATKKKAKSKKSEGGEE
jgi:large subunit ribosomal protein L22